jgi:glyoxylase-like metal-dependent hydrolase (beta-lactamase superfamily II)
MTDTCDDVLCVSIGTPCPFVGTTKTDGIEQHQSDLGTVDAKPVHNKSVDSARPAPMIDDLGDDVFAIDTQMAGHTGITSSYLIRGSRPCLVETGTALSAPVVIDALAALGISPEDLSSIVVTHIHLDHAGGVGDLAAAFPNAQVVVHERGARHLADPTKLVASAQRVFGPDMDRLFGPLLPTPAERLTTLGDKGFVDLGDGRHLDTFHNPGHASHHVALVDSQTGDLYTGDAAGVFVPDTEEVRPATPPPDFDLNLALDSLSKMRAAKPTRLLFSHFGAVNDVDRVFADSEAELHYWVEDVSEAYHSGMDLDHAVAMVKEKDRARHPNFYDDAERSAKFEELSSTQAQVSGIWRWLEKSETNS